MGDFYNRCETFSLHLLSALELALQLPQGSFVTKCTGKASELRLLHYPSISTRDIQKGKVSRIWPHFDLGVITLLFQDHVGGLEIQERASPTPDTFIAVGCERQSDMVVNISETLQRWTNDRLPAGLHRVTTPRGMVDGMIPERYTVAYFCKADRNARVGSLPQFCVRELRKYENMTALEYHQQRLASAYAY